MTQVWFPEPTRADDTWAVRLEHPHHWLARSTLPQARAMRDFLNRNLAAMPAPVATRIEHDLRHRWVSALLELVVYRTLQVLGAHIEVEQATASGSRPDFLASFPGGSTVVVEVVSPVVNAWAGNLVRERVPLLEYLEKRVPAGWRAAVWNLPRIAPHEPMGEYKRVVTKMLRLLPEPTPGGRD
jgi:hypothetical protein